MKRTYSQQWDTWNVRISDIHFTHILFFMINRLFRLLLVCSQDLQCCQGWLSHSFQQQCDRIIWQHFWSHCTVYVKAFEKNNTKNSPYVNFDFTNLISSVVWKIILNKKIQAPIFWLVMFLIVCVCKTSYSFKVWL